MNQFIFKSRWIAIAFATLTLFSVYAFVGGEDDGGLFNGIRSDLPGEDDEAQLAASGTREPAPAPQPEMEMMVDEEFVDDTELIDSASGEDPTPDDGGDMMSEDGEDSQPQFVPESELVDADSFDESQAE